MLSPGLLFTALIMSVNNRSETEDREGDAVLPVGDSSGKVIGSSNLLALFFEHDLMCVSGPHLADFFEFSQLDYSYYGEAGRSPFDDFFLFCNLQKKYPPPSQNRSVIAGWPSRKPETGIRF